MDYQLAHDESKPKFRKYPICLLANDLDAPTNVGGLFRMADALGVEKIYLSGTTPVPPGKKINRTARSTVKVVAYEYCENPLEVVAALRQAGYKIVSLEITKQSIDVTKFEVAADDKICLIIGSEGWGVRHDLLNASDAAIHIQMRGVNSSMNVAVATSIAVFELTKRIDELMS